MFMCSPLMSSQRLLNNGRTGRDGSSGTLERGVANTKTSSGLSIWCPLVEDMAHEQDILQENCSTGQSQYLV